MDRKEFQELAVRTESLVEDPKLTPDNYQILLDTFRAYNNVVEVLDLFKKHIFYGKELDLRAVRGYASDAREWMFDVGMTTAEALVKEDQGEVITASKSVAEDPRVFHAILGTITEHGELGIALLEQLEGKELDLVNVCEELGDSDWYKALFFEATGIDWETVQAMIIKKLEVRYADKIFDAEESLDRNLEEERELLEATLIGYVEKYVEKQ